MHNAAMRSYLLLMSCPQERVRGDASPAVGVWCVPIASPVFFRAAAGGQSGVPEELHQPMVGVDAIVYDV